MQPQPYDTEEFPPCIPTMQVQPGLESCLHEGVQYMPCIVPLEQWEAYQDSGAVPIAQVAATDLSDGVLPQDKLANLMSAVGGDDSPRSVVSSVTARFKSRRWAEMLEDPSSDRDDERIMGSSTRSPSAASSSRWTDSAASSNTTAFTGRQRCGSDPSVHCGICFSCSHSHSSQSAESQAHSAPAASGSSFTQMEVNAGELAVVVPEVSSAVALHTSTESLIKRGRARCKKKSTSPVPAAAALNPPRRKETHVDVSTLQAEIVRLRDQEKCLAQEASILREQNKSLQGKLKDSAQAASDDAAERSPKTRRNVRRQIVEPRGDIRNAWLNRMQKQGWRAAENAMVLIALLIVTLVIVPTCSRLGASVGGLIGQRLP